MKKILVIFNLCLFFYAACACAKNYPVFSVHKLESGRHGNTVLVIGGIQGDEPGGFNAASLLVTHYNIRKGNVWVVPNLNFISIIKRSRGVYGDMNRKFAALQNSDPEFSIIKKIKELIIDDQVDLVLNLHDGSGFYRHAYIDRMHNPGRWGQSIIIDQEEIHTEHHGNIGEIARGIASDINRHLYSMEHAFHVKNTRTCKGDLEMAKTLTYFAICNEKPAFGLETSKSFPTAKRSYYHLRMLEAFMDIAGIEYDRHFQLSARGVKRAINDNIKFALYDSRIFLDVGNARERLGYMPFKKDSEVEFVPSNPLVAMVSSGNSYRVFHGNRRLTRIYPEYFEYDLSIDTITMQIDGSEKIINFGQIVDVNDSFLVVPQKDYRVNVIGYKKKGVANESGINICKNDIQKRFSVDKRGRIFRVEVYREKKFTGMVLVSFDSKPATITASKPWKLSQAEHSHVSDIR